MLAALPFRQVEPGQLFFFLNRLPFVCFLIPASSMALGVVQTDNIHPNQDNFV